MSIIKPTARIREFLQGERVSSGKERWGFGVIKQHLGRLHYLVQLDNGSLIKRHVDQLLGTNVPRKTVTFKDAKEAKSPVIVRRAVSVYPEISQQALPPILVPRKSERTRRPIVRLNL